MAEPIRVDAGIIGGTGVGSRLVALGGRALAVPTPQGTMRGRLLDVDGFRIAAIQRHAAGHKMPPHRVGYHAIALGLRALGAKVCLASAAVGSLRPDWPPGTFVACTDLIDLTYRRPTLFDRTVVHTDMTSPFPASAGLLETCRNHRREARTPAVYVCGDGPRYETAHEIRVMRQLGGDVVGMTAATEAILMREAGVPYGCLAVVTNLAAGLSPSELHHTEVEDVMREEDEAVVAILLDAARALARA